jgi:DNA-binding transcriptional LysR family regulator
MSMHFDLVDLRLMVCIAEANSLIKGVEASHISLPVASTRIKNLEESIGTKLLNRTSQGGHPHAAGPGLCAPCPHGAGPDSAPAG